MTAARRSIDSAHITSGPRSTATRRARRRSRIGNRPARHEGERDDDVRRRRRVVSPRRGRGRRVAGAGGVGQLGVRRPPRDPQRERPRPSVGLRHPRAVIVCRRRDSGSRVDRDAAATVDVVAMRLSAYWWIWIPATVGVATDAAILLRVRATWWGRHATRNHGSRRLRRGPCALDVVAGHGAGGRAWQRVGVEESCRPSGAGDVATTL